MVFPNANIMQTATLQMSEDRQRGASTSVEDYALIAGGWSNGGSSGYTYATTYAYNTSLTGSSSPAISQGRYDLAATSIGEYALFGGGSYRSYTNQFYMAPTVDAYNNSLTRSNPSDLSIGRNELTATNIGDYAIFAGGSAVVNTNGTSYVDAYDSSLTKSNIASLSENKRALVSSSIKNNYALFAGGNVAVYKVDTYNTSLVKTTLEPLARYYVGAGSISDYILIAGGRNSSGFVTTVEVYDKYLTKREIQPLLHSQYVKANANIKNYFTIFAMNGAGIDTYNSSLTRVDSNISFSSYGSATSIGSFALFSGNGTKNVAALSAVII